MEYKFRGKRKDNGEWVYGWYSRQRGFAEILTKNGTQYGNYEVIPETVGMYTGLKDKNGKGIYSGDIVKIPDDYGKFGQFAGGKREVIFAYGGFRLKPKWDKSAKGNWLEDDECFEIIGNIHE